MRISLVTPSFNKAPFLEATLRSVLDQRYSKLEYGVIDGGSTDGSKEILGLYADRLAFVVSEPDQGMYDALNKGFSKTSGEIMGYLGADDLHMPWTLGLVSELFATFPGIQWMTSLFPLTADASGRVVKARTMPAPTPAAFFRGAFLPGFSWRAHGWIQQESTFWRRSLWERVNGLDQSAKLAGDFDLWCRFMRVGGPAGVLTPLAAFRRHGNQITGTQAEAYRQEALTAFKRHGGRPDSALASSVREAIRRLGLSRPGCALSYDFGRNQWQTLPG